MIYIYYCKACNTTYKVKHSIKENGDLLCKTCGGLLRKDLRAFSNATSFVSDKDKIGYQADAAMEALEKYKKEFE